MPADRSFSIPGTAGVSPASSNQFAQGTAEFLPFSNVAFNESGRDAAVPEEVDRITPIRVFPRSSAAAFLNRAALSQFPSCALATDPHQWS
jgi:hypothetical protein